MKKNKQLFKKQIASNAKKLEAQRYQNSESYKNFNAAYVKMQKAISKKQSKYHLNQDLSTLIDGMVLK